MFACMERPAHYPQERRLQLARRPHRRVQAPFRLLWRHPHGRVHEVDRGSLRRLAVRRSCEARCQRRRFPRSGCNPGGAREPIPREERAVLVALGIPWLHLDDRRQAVPYLAPVVPCFGPGRCFMARLGRRLVARHRLFVLNGQASERATDLRVSRRRARASTWRAARQAKRAPLGTITATSRPETC